MNQYEMNLRCWGHAGIQMLLSDQQLRTLVGRVRGWPWNGYELIVTRKAGRYPPQRLAPLTTMLVELRRELAVNAADPMFPDYLLGIFIVSQSDEFGTSQMVGTCPL
jgi:hypothetical protein